MIAYCVKSEEPFCSTHIPLAPFSSTHVRNRVQILCVAYHLAARSASIPQSMHCTFATASTNVTFFCQYLFIKWIIANNQVIVSPLFLSFLKQSSSTRFQGTGTMTTTAAKKPVLPGAELVGRGIFIRPRHPYELKNKIFNSNKIKNKWRKNCCHWKNFRRTKLWL